MSALNLRVKQSENPVSGDIDIFIWTEKDGQLYGVKGLEIDWENPVNPNLSGSAIESFASVSKESAQVLLDDLFAAGIRPSKGRDVTGELKAKDAHIAFAQRTVEALIQCLPQSQPKN